MNPSLATAPLCGCSITELRIIASTDYTKRGLRMVYKDYKLTFNELLHKDNSFSIHHRNLQRFAMEMHKAYNDLSPSLVKSSFPTRKIPYNLRNCNPFKFTNVHTVFKGTETIALRGPKIWSLVPDHIKHAKAVSEFKTTRLGTCWLHMQVMQHFIPNRFFMNYYYYFSQLRTLRYKNLPMITVLDL